MGSLVFIPPSSVPDGPPAATINIYVATTGSDANPGTIAAPKLTMAGAWAELPPVQSGNFIMHLASGSYTFTAPPPNVQEGVAQTAIIGDGAGQGVDDGFTVVGTGILSAPTTGTTIVPTVAMVVDQYAFCTIEWTSGAAIGRRSIVLRNTTTTIWHAKPTVAAAGDTFRILRPAVVLSFDVNTDPTLSVFNYANGMKVLHLVQLSIATVSGSLSRIGNSVDTVTEMFGVELRANVSLLNRSTSMSGAANANTIFALGFNVPLLFGSTYTLWETWGLTTVASGIEAFASTGLFNGYISTAGNLTTSRNLILRCCRCSNLTVGKNSKYSIQTPALIFIVPTDASIPVFVDGGELNGTGAGPYTIDVTANTNVVRVSSGGILDASTSWVITSAATTQAAILIEPGGELKMQANNMTVTASAFAAMQVFGLFDMNQGGSLTVSGAAAGAGAVQIGNGGLMQLMDGSYNITNSSAAANSDGVRISGTGRWVSNANPTIGTSGISGFGVNCRGMGQFICPGQPTAVTGPTADFTIGTGGGENFPDTDLAASFSFKASGGSIVQRST